MEERIMTLHPEGKQGVNLLKRRYDQVKDAILAVLENGGEVTFRDLPDLVGEKLGDQFDGKIMWYVTTVKLDLEARGLIERIPRKSPQVLRIPA